MNIVKEALFFPIDKKNAKMFVYLIVIYLLHYLMLFLPIIGIFSLAFLGYIYATQFKIIYTTGNGYADAPDFPDFSDLFDGIVIPLFKVMGVYAIGFLPIFLIYYQLEPTGLTESLLLWLPYFYIPLGLMIAAMDDFVYVLNPMVIIESIREAGITYFAMVGAFIAITEATFFMNEYFYGSWIISPIIGAYGTMFTGRLIGAVYRDRLAEELIVEETE